MFWPFLRLRFFEGRASAPLKSCLSPGTFVFLFLWPLISFASGSIVDPNVSPWDKNHVPLGLRVLALYDADTQFQMGNDYEHKDRPLLAMKFYWKAVRQKHPDVANRLAVLLERNRQMSAEAIDLHQMAVEWDALGRFSPIPVRPDDFDVRGEKTA